MHSGRTRASTRVPQRDPKSCQAATINVTLHRKFERRMHKLGVINLRKKRCSQRDKPERERKEERERASSHFRILGIPREQNMSRHKFVPIFCSRFFSFFVCVCVCVSCACSAGCHCVVASRFIFFVAYFQAGIQFQPPPALRCFCSALFSLFLAAQHNFLLIGFQ